MVHNKKKRFNEAFPCQGHLLTRNLAIMGLCPDQFELVSKVSLLVVTSHCGLILEMSRKAGEGETYWLCAVVAFE